MYRIFIVEDDRAIAAALCESARSWGMDARTCEDFQNVPAEFSRYEPHLVFMDIQLPFFNGFHWCSELRKISNVPIIVISSRQDNMSQVMAMNMGADDYIVKPFDFDVATAKTQALLRRAYNFTHEQSALTSGGASLNLKDGKLLFDGRELSLTQNEQRVLQTLMEHPGRVVSRETLMLKLWASDSFVDDNTLTVNINRLRKKLEGVGLRDFIRTRFGEGYYIEKEE